MLGGKMDQEYLKQLSNLITGMGQLTQIWTITYQSFKEQKMTDDEAIKHTRALLATMFRAMMNGEE